MFTERGQPRHCCAGPWGEGPGGPHAPSCFSVRSLVASSEDRERLPRGLPEMILTRSLLFIRLYLFSDRLTNCGERRRAGGQDGRAEWEGGAEFSGLQESDWAAPGRQNQPGFCFNLDSTLGGPGQNTSVVKRPWDTPATVAEDTSCHY